MKTRGCIQRDDIKNMWQTTGHQQSQPIRTGVDLTPQPNDPFAPRLLGIPKKPGKAPASQYFNIWWSHSGAHWLDTSSVHERILALITVVYSNPHGSHAKFRFISSPYAEASDLILPGAPDGVKTLE